MSFPKQWGKPSPEGLGKLRTASKVDMPYMTVSGQGFIGKKNGEFSSVTTFSEDREKKVKAVFFNIAEIKTREFTHAACAEFSPTGKVEKFKRTNFVYSDSTFFGKQVTYHGDAVSRKEVQYVTSYLSSSPFTVGPQLYERTIKQVDATERPTLGRDPYEEGEEVDKILIQGRTLGRPVDPYFYPAFVSNHSFYNPKPVASFLGAPSRVDGKLVWVTVSSFFIDEVSVTGSKISGLRVTWSFDGEKKLVDIGQIDTSAIDHPAGKANIVLISLAQFGEKKLSMLIGQYPVLLNSVNAPGVTTSDTSFDGVQAVYGNPPGVFFCTSEDAGRNWSFKRIKLFNDAYFFSKTWVGSHLYESKLNLLSFDVAQVYARLSGEIMCVSPDSHYMFSELHHNKLYSLNKYHIELLPLSPSTFLVFGCIVEMSYQHFDTFIERESFKIWRTFVLRTTDGGVTWDGLETPISSKITPGYSGFTEDNFCRDERWLTYPVILRDGVVLVRCVNAGKVPDSAISVGNFEAEGAPGDNEFENSVVFMLSNDYGATWQGFYPGGLPSLAAKDIGMLTVFSSGKDHSKVVMPVQADGAVWMFSSTDDGRTWKEERVITRLGVERFTLQPPVFSSVSSGVHLGSRIALVRNKNGKFVSDKIGAPWIWD